MINCTFHRTSWKRGGNSLARTRKFVTDSWIPLRRWLPFQKGRINHRAQILMIVRYNNRIASRVSSN